jgi:hypothetical protein
MLPIALCAHAAFGTCVRAAAPPPMAHEGVCDLLLVQVAWPHLVHTYNGMQCYPLLSELMPPMARACVSDLLLVQVARGRLAAHGTRLCVRLALGTSGTRPPRRPWHASVCPTCSWYKWHAAASPPMARVCVSDLHIQWHTMLTIALCTSGGFPTFGKEGVT